MGSSPLLKARRNYKLVLPKLLEDIKSFTFSEGKATASLGDQDELKKLFPKLFGRPILKGKKGESRQNKPLKIGVVLSGGQASGGHNVIIGIFDAIKAMHAESHLIGFLNGPSGIVEGKYKELQQGELSSFRNTGGFDLIGSGRTKIETEEQLAKALAVIHSCELDGLVIIGGDDSNTNAAVLGEYLLQHQCKTSVVGVPKTIDGDLQNDYVEISFGFDTACKTYAEMIGNLSRDTLSAKKYTHFIKLMGRSASHIALECALQTHPNLTFISEEVAEKKQTLRALAKEVADLVEARAEVGKNYGIILLPEGLIEQVPEMHRLITELNTLLARPEFSSLGPKEALPKMLQTLQGEQKTTFASLPESIQRQLLLDRDPHGNVQVAHIETEKLLIEMVSSELKTRQFKGKFNPLQHSFGYEGRAGFPSNFDATYCYALGFTAAALVRDYYSGYMACVRGLIAPAQSWDVMGVPLVSLMHLEMRKGKKKPVIEKALVTTKGAAFQLFASRRSQWRIEDDYCFPGPMQFFGDPAVTDTVPLIIRSSGSPM